MIRQVGKGPNEQPLVWSVVTDPEEVARIRAVDEQVRRNGEWLQAHQAELYAQPKGKFLAVSGQEAFWGETAEEAYALARAAHPEDWGVLVRYTLMPQGHRIYACRG